MAKSLTPVELPADPSAALQAATKQYVDNHDWSAADITTGVLGSGRIPRVLATIATGNVTTNSGVDHDANQASGANLMADWTLTANVTEVTVPTNGTNGQVYKMRFYASGATRTVTFASGIRTSTGLTRGAYSIPSGECLIATLEYVGMISAWVLTAATISGT